MRFLRRITVGVLSAVLLTGCFNPLTAQAAQSAPVRQLCCGDTNGDGVISIADCELLQLSLAEYSHAYPFNIPRESFLRLCDADGNGFVSVSDVTALQRYLAELDTDSPQIGREAVSLEELYRQDSDGKMRSVCELANQDFSYNMVNDQVSRYLLRADYSPDDYTKTAVPELAPGVRSDRPQRLTLSLPQNAYETVLYDSEGGIAAAFSDNIIVNLVPGTYTYSVKDRFGVRLQTGSIQANGTLRMIDAGGITFNIRDVGGRKCDGGTMRYGFMYRGCELNGDNYNITLNDAQKALFTDFLNIKDEIDLRADTEVDGADHIVGTEDDIRSSALGDSVEYIRLPVAPYTVGVNLTNPYQMNYYATLLKRIARDALDNKPCYIHCMAGADRTGTLCALAEAICGMSQRDIDCDYELTSFSAGNYRARNDESWQSLMSFLNSMPGDNLRDKAVAYALAIGVSMDEINMLRRGMIDGNPEVLR